jgi:hypothetical protein
VRFDSPLDELDHWLQTLELEMYRGTDQRHVLVLARLCEVFAMKISRDKRAPSSQLERRMRLSMRWLDLQRQLGASAPSNATPPDRRGWKPRVIDGGKNHRARASR